MASPVLRIEFDREEEQSCFGFQSESDIPAKEQSVCESEPTSCGDDDSDAIVRLPRREVLQETEPLSLARVRQLAEEGDLKCRKSLQALERLAPEKRPSATWAMLHRMATQRGLSQYKDPATGYLVFTAGHLKKQPCCGFGCRHCPHSRGLSASATPDW
mmetsp:Transcript_13846/g.30531  ORF Transcript_13846/g.30531 Transcript_13846/m.30531 type:complete len:159 (-) Transcript_13846:27-503(-)